jgi:hypothetical protein
MVIRLTVVIIEACPYYQLRTTFRPVILSSYTILSNTYLLRLIPYSDEIIGNCQRGFRYNTSTKDQVLIHFKKAYDSVSREYCTIFPLNLAY